MRQIHHYQSVDQFCIYTQPGLTSIARVNKCIIREYGEQAWQVIFRLSLQPNWARNQPPRS